MTAGFLPTKADRLAAGEQWRERRTETLLTDKVIDPVSGSIRQVVTTGRCRRRGRPSAFQAPDGPDTCRIRA
ncbi:hypothetical protein [Kitasatospora sp. GP82]|uniref:hypothetical protein n=1 Tax=Kitasatospora sp. GP82 TaxID=3035089 RepID=UPI0024755728|nr:hypothetical protein [Kitasatospora sp. GP82]MDH6124969.1 hypothetical protein [Kitasatospora sp. GP82]